MRKVLIMLTIIQSDKDHTKRALIKLHPGSYVAPSGNVIGSYQVVFPRLTRNAAIALLTKHFQRDPVGVSLWWHGAAADIAANIQIKE